MIHTRVAIERHLLLAAVVFILQTSIECTSSSIQMSASSNQLSVEELNSGTGVFATVGVNSLEVTLSAPASVTAGSVFQVSASVGNGGATNIVGVKAILNPGAIELKGNEDRQLGIVLPSQTKETRWNLVAEDAGTYIILVTVTGTEEVSGDLLEIQDTALIEVS